MYSILGRAPFALITASIRRGVEVISLWHCWGGMKPRFLWLWPSTLYMLPLGNIIRKYGISFHCYADDTQLYISTRPDETSKLSKLTECVKNIKDWMTNNFILLNSDKTEILLIGPKNSTQNLLDHNLKLDGCTVTSSTVKNLGVILDSNLSFENHISHVTKHYSILPS